jgi:hypothetical protein
MKEQNDINNVKIKFHQNQKGGGETFIKNET